MEYTVEYTYRGYIIKVQGVFQDTVITLPESGHVVAQALDVESAKEMIREFLPKVTT